MCVVDQTQTNTSGYSLTCICRRFPPQAYLPSLYSAGPTTCRHGATLVIKVDERRSPVSEQPAPVV